MKCPKCGQWNRAGFERCVKCGEELGKIELFEKKPTPVELSHEEIRKKQEKKPVKYISDHLGNMETTKDKRDEEAAKAYKAAEERKKKERGEAPFLGHTNGFFEPAGNGSYISARVDSRNSMKPANNERRELSIAKSKQGTKRMNGFFRQIVIVTALLGLLFAIAFFVIDYLKPKELKTEKANGSIVETIQASIVDENPSHNIRLKLEKGKMLYIKELRKLVGPSDGHISFDIPDYVWYEDREENLNDDSSYLPESLDVSFTPYLRAENGNLTPLEQIKYKIDIPSSEYILLNPNSPKTESNLNTYNIRFKVDPNSNVYYVDSNSDAKTVSQINIQNGLASFSASLIKGRTNSFLFLVKTEHQRISKIRIDIDKPSQAFDLYFDDNTDDESSREKMIVKGKTLPNVALEVLSPHDKLEISPETGKFKFDAIMSKYGTNKIIVRGRYDGKEETISHDVYYTPDINGYTSKAWSLNDGFGYSNLLANLKDRIKNAQVYVIYGTVLEVISTKPQLAIVDASDGKGSNPLLVLLENQSKTTWEAGEKYRLYGEASGMYDSYPRLLVRYTYKRK